MLITSLVVTAALALPEASSAFFRSINTQNHSVILELFVAPNGETLDCEVLYATLAEENQSAFCEKLIGKDSGSGAIDANGNRTHGVIVLSKMTGLSAPDMEMTADLEVMVEALPAGAERMRASFLAEFDETGSVKECYGSSIKYPQIAKVACDESKGHSFVVRVGADGVPVSYISSLSVDFVVTDEASS